jgi:hypothetical protein
LETADGLYQAPGIGPSTAELFLHDSSGTGRLLMVDSHGSVVPILDQVRRVESITCVGSYLVVGATRPPGVDDPAQDSLNLVQVPPGGANPIVVRLPSGCDLTRAAASARHGLFTAVLEFDTGERLGRLKVPNPNGASISPTLFFFGPTVGLSADGAVQATVQLGLDQVAFAWSDLGTQLIRMKRGDGFLLPGL